MKPDKTLAELYELWDESQIYIAEAIRELDKLIVEVKVDLFKQQTNLAKLLEVLKNGK